MASSSSKIRAFELQSKSKTDLFEQLNELKTELGSLRVAKIAGGSASKVTKINSVRKSIARVLTVINQKQRQNLKEFYKGKKPPAPPLPLRFSSLYADALPISLPTSVSVSPSLFSLFALILWNTSPSAALSPTDMPLDLRYKKTRAIRRRLSAKESSAITEKAHKKAIHFPQRKFALKA
ncbi:large subunit ribosomal protein L35e, partial [Tremellales sp. Uapishka_1]